MDRRQRSWIFRGGLGLLLMAAATGCRGLRNEVPPAPPYNADGTNAMPAVGLSGGPPQGAFAAIPPTTAPGTSPYGGPGGSMGGYGAPTGNSYGPPGTAGTAGPYGYGPAGAGGAGPQLGSAAPAPGGPADPGTVPSGFDPATSATAPVGGAGMMGNPNGGPSPY